MQRSSVVSPLKNTIAPPFKISMSISATIPSFDPIFSSRAIIFLFEIGINGWVLNLATMVDAETIRILTPGNFPVLQRKCASVLDPDGR